MDENLWTGLGGIVVAFSIVVTLQIASAVDGSPAATTADDPLSNVNAAETVAAGVKASAI